MFGKKPEVLVTDLLTEENSDLLSDLNIAFAMAVSFKRKLSEVMSKNDDVRQKTRRAMKLNPGLATEFYEAAKRKEDFHVQFDAKGLDDRKKGQIIEEVCKTDVQMAEIIAFVQMREYGFSLPAQFFPRDLFESVTQGEGGFLKDRDIKQILKDCGAPTLSEICPFNPKP